MKKLAGIMFIHNGISMDYCFKECIESMVQSCNHVYVLDAGSDDGTLESLQIIERIELLKSSRITLLTSTKEEWAAQKGKEKLSYFTNIAIQRAEKDGYEYVLNVQADEVLHESSYQSVVKAVFSGGDAFMCSRINLWQSPYMKLDVPQDRKPCSTEIIRLTKSKYRSVDDAENIGAPNVCMSYLKDIRIYHMGFVRHRNIMKDKVIYIQEKVFQMEHDKKLDGVDTFVPQRWFSNDDLKPIDEPLPKVIKKWALERVYKD